METPFQLIKSLLEAKAIKEIKDGEISSRSNQDDITVTKLLGRTIDNKKFN